MKELFEIVPVESFYYAGAYVLGGLIITPILKRLIRKTIELRYRTSKKGDPRQGETVIKLLQNVLKYIMGIIIIIGILNSFGVNTTALIASAGLIGVAIGFGAQSFFKDVIAGLFFIIEDQLNVGDFVEINGFKGIVLEVGLKTTKLKNWLGEVKFLPNGSITEIVNYSLSNPCIYIDVPVTYEEDIDKVEKVLRKLSKQLKKEIREIVGEVEVLGVQELADSSVNIRITAECKNGEQFGVKRKMLKIIKQKLDKEKISIPYPQITVHGINSGK